MSATTCPGCGAPAEITDRFTLASTHCLVNPAGFWVSGKDTSVVRRPWCLSCCDDLDRERCDMIPFGR
jgi:hypothetical protein